MNRNLIDRRTLNTSENYLVHYWLIGMIIYSLHSFFVEEKFIFILLIGVQRKIFSSFYLTVNRQCFYFDRITYQWQYPSYIVSIKPKISNIIQFYISNTRVFIVFASFRLINITLEDRSLFSIVIYLYVVVNADWRRSYAK